MEACDDERHQEQGVRSPLRNEMSDSMAPRDRSGHIIDAMG